ncbi:MAG: DUF3631 domain-containing protein, partial [Zoogloeaceae bacterium]|nr:DUF3631 domain-containing protein [Zoogloeaceae bacterium]
AALTLSKAGDDSSSVGNELLADIREILETRHLTKISTVDLIKALCEDDEKPWSTYNRGNPVKPRQIAKWLKEYGIASKTIRISTYETLKGFETEQFQEAFSRYLTPTLPLTPPVSVTAQQTNNHAGFPVTDKKKRYGYGNVSVTPEAAPLLDCYAVTDRNGGVGGGRENSGGKDEIIEVTI